MVQPPDYQPFYCEENVWRLCQDPRLGAAERLVAVVTGSGPGGDDRRCAFYHQRLAGAVGEPVLWDFHVVLLVRGDGWQAWDLDSDLGAPVAAEEYLGATFGDQQLVPAPLRPRLRLIDAATYVARLHSDRSHMRDHSGAYLQPPPPWPPPGGGSEHNLAAFLDPDQPFLGEVVSLSGLRRRLAGDRGR